MGYPGIFAIFFIAVQAINMLATRILQGQKLSSKMLKTVLAPYAVWQAQPLDHLAVFQMRFDDIVNVVVVHKAVPHTLGVHHRHRAARAAVQTTRFVHADLPLAAQIGFFDQLFAAVKALLRMVLEAAVFTVFALVEAKKDVAFVIRFIGGLFGSHFSAVIDGDVFSSMPYFSYRRGLPP
jgi:hypothetical protein